MNLTNQNIHNVWKSVRRNTMTSKTAASKKKARAAEEREMKKLVNEALASSTARSATKTSSSPGHSAT